MQFHTIKDTCEDYHRDIPSIYLSFCKVMWNVNALVKSDIQ